LIAHWVWSADGWLSAYNVSYNPLFNCGMLDFAGDSVVHIVGGFSGLAGAIIVGYRGQFVKDKERFPPRFEKDKDGNWHTNDFPPNNEALATLGVLCLWFGWYGFNCGSTGALVGKNDISARVAVTTTLAASAGAISTFIFGKYFDRAPSFSLSDTLNGILAGLVAITGPCPVVTAYGAIIIGATGGIIFKLFSRLMLKLRIDDPLDAFAVHGGVGMWGLLMAGFFATKEYTQETYGAQHYDWGVFYGGSGRQLVVQIVGVIVTPLWPMFWGVVIFGFYRIIDQRRPDDTWFIFMDYSSFEVLTFGGKNEPEQDFRDPLAREMKDIPTTKKSLEDSKQSGSAIVVKNRKESDDSGTATASSDEDQPSGSHKLDELPV